MDYRNEDEALIGLATQLAYAYDEARTAADEEYAADAIDDFLSDHDNDAPPEALLALLDVPLTPLTEPLIAHVEFTLSDRGPAVVEAVLRVAAGRHRAAEGAAETLGLMDESELIQGLIEVLAGRDDDLKAVAVKGLVALGRAAVGALEAALYDPAVRPWAEDTLGDIRAGEPGWILPDVVAAAEARATTADDDPPAEGETAPQEEPALNIEPADRAAAAAGPADPEATTGIPPSAPDAATVNESYEEFLERFDRESGR